MKPGTWTVGKLSSVPFVAIAVMIGLPLSATSQDNGNAPRPHPAVSAGSGSFELVGLLSPATVAETIFVQCPSLPHDSVVTYFLDGHAIRSTSTYPFWLGGMSAPSGFSVAAYTPGPHLLRASAVQRDGRILGSKAILLNVVTSLNSQFSATLQAYQNDPSAQQIAPEKLLARVTTPVAAVSSSDLLRRRQVMGMYLNWGVDPSLDVLNDQSPVLAALLPSGWSLPTPSRNAVPLSMQFSPDAPFYRAIPAAWPRVPLPMNYIRTVQLNTSPDGDGIGFGEVIAKSSDPIVPVRSEWFNVADTLHTYSFRIPRDWAESLPRQERGDRHMIFIDSATRTFVSAYKTSVDAARHNPDALYAAPPTSFDSLGDRGGSVAADFAELPLLLQPGEATNPNQSIGHALGGPVGRVWAARVYPASARDANVLSSKNTCTNSGYTNTGLVPYGGVIQLDPVLDLARLKLSLPAYRILKAIQTYGYYVMDFGCSDLDIYTAVPQTELDPFGGLWGNRNGPGVQNEIQAVLTNHKLYVVAPMTKKE